MFSYDTPLPAEGIFLAALVDRNGTDVRSLFGGHRYLTFAAVLMMLNALVLFTQQVKLWVNPESAPISTLTLAGLGSLTAVLPGGHRRR